MSEETILTAARRIVRFVRADDHAHGGLLSRDTIRAADTLDREVKRAEAALKEREVLASRTMEGEGA